MMRRRYQRGYLRCTKRKVGPDCWEFLWRETDEAGKRVRRTAVIGTVEKFRRETWLKRRWTGSECK
jgi:hypothetical protein